MPGNPSIPFNKPHLAGREVAYIQDAVDTGKISGNGKYTRLCHAFFEERYGFKRCLLTQSCTDALEMAALLLDIRAGDEVIMPSYTFVSTANAFVLRGAGIVFCDSMEHDPNIDAARIEALITPRTKAIVVVHYAGVACDMDRIMALADRYSLAVVEDAAHAIDSRFIQREGGSRPLGGIGHLAAFSFHETKNIIAGEGGMLVVNDDRFAARAEIIWEKGTNRSAFFRGETDKYGWVAVGSSFLPSEITAAFLFAQLEAIDAIQARRKEIWDDYYERLRPLEERGHFRLPVVPAYATRNGHLFHLVCRTAEVRDRLIQGLKERGVLAVFHYQGLHRSPFFKDKYQGEPLPNCDAFSDRLVRLPLFCDLTSGEVERICTYIAEILS